MAIKIDWKDLSKRIINGKEVEKVMLNGIQIWPEVTPPTPTPVPPLTADWFHVPCQEEWNEIVAIMDSLGYTNIQDYVEILHLPLAWHLAHNTGALTWRWTNAGYWCSVQASSSTAYSLNLASWASVAVGSEWKSEWLPIRCVRDYWKDDDYSGFSYGVTYDSTKWIIYLTEKVYNPDIEDYEGWITIAIADRNLWATAVYNYGDALTENNCWDYFQWWNNYWFTAGDLPATSPTMVANTIWHWLWNPYSSDTFICTTWWDWATIANEELWIIPTTRWPKVWFHLPTVQEAWWLSVLAETIYRSSGWWERWPKMAETLFIPEDCWEGEYWEDWEARFIQNNHYNTSSHKGVSYALCLRLFKDTPIEPDSSWTLIAWDAVYYNASLWLISANTTYGWVTLEDKNLGATEVWHPWDTKTEANCGNKYQWWNCHPFSYAWTETRVNYGLAYTWGYGSTEWKYYSCAALCRLPSWNDDWYIPANSNMW